MKQPMDEFIGIEGLARVAPFRLRLWFSNGQSGEWDFSWMRAADGVLLRPFRKPGYFERVMFAPRFLAWPNSYDWCVDALYADMQKAGALEMHRSPLRSDVVGRLVPMPAPIQAIYEAVDTLERAYPGRKFTPDGHLVGSVGEVIAREALGLTLYPASRPGHDAHDDQQREVQIKLTGGNSVALRATCDRLLVMKVFDPGFAEIVYYGEGSPVWEACGGLQAANGQRTISLSKLRTIGRAAAVGALPSPGSAEN